VNCCVDGYVPLSKAVVPFSSVAVPFNVLAEAGNTPSEMRPTLRSWKCDPQSRGAILLFIVKLSIGREDFLCAKDEVISCCRCW